MPASFSSVQLKTTEESSQIEKWHHSDNFSEPYKVCGCEMYLQVDVGQQIYSFRSHFSSIIWEIEETEPQSSHENSEPGGNCNDFQQEMVARNDGYVLLFFNVKNGSHQYFWILFSVSKTYHWTFS